RNEGDFRCGLFEGASAEIGETDPQAHRGEAFGRGKADPARRAGDDGDPAFGQRTMLSHNNPPLPSVLYRNSRQIIALGGRPIASRRGTRQAMRATFAGRGFDEGSAWRRTRLAYSPRWTVST